MDETLRELDNLSAVIQTEQAIVPRFVIASCYDLPVDAKIEVGTKASDDDDDEEEESLLTRKKRRTANHDELNDAQDELKGTWTVTLGCEKGWWSISLQTQELSNTIIDSSSALSEQLNNANVRAFADKVRSAFQRQSILFGAKKPSDASFASSSSSTPLWPAIKLYLDLDVDPIELKLSHLSTEAALQRSTRILLSLPALSSPSSSSLPVKATSLPSYELQSLQRKLEASQQALREERHKYRSLLAAPSAASARAGRRPVVGLGPGLPSASQNQRSNFLPSSSPSSSHSRSSKTGGAAASSSSGFGGPSSDDLQGESMGAGGRSLTRTLSLVNPTRVQRADPSENDGFLGDEDGDETILQSQREKRKDRREGR